MKKLITIISILLMVFSLVACNNNSTNPSIPNKPSVPTKPIPITPSEPTTTPTEPTINQDAPIYIEGRQELLEHVFSEGLFKVDANSFKIIIEDTMDILVLTDTSGKSYFGISGTIDDSKIGAVLYQHNEHTAYFHEFLYAEDQTIDRWYQCNITSMENEDILDSTESGTSNVNDFLDALNQIEKIEYVESIGNIDYVNMHYWPSNENDGWTTVYDSTLQIELNGNIGEFRYTTMASDEGFGTSSSWCWTKEIEGMNLFDWEFNPGTMTLTKDDVVIECTFVKDHIKNPDEKTPMIMHIAIDSNTHEILNMSTTEDGLATSIEFIKCDDVSEYVGLPENIEDNKIIEDAILQFSMTMLALITSNPDII